MTNTILNAIIEKVNQFFFNLSLEVFNFSPVVETLMLVILLIAVSSDRSTLAAAYGEPPLRYPVIKNNQTLPVFKLAAFTTASSTTTTTTTLSTAATKARPPKSTTTRLTTTATTTTAFECDEEEKWKCGPICIPKWQFCPLLESCHPAFPVVCNEDGRCLAKPEDCSKTLSNSSSPIASLSLSLSTESPTSSAFISCRANEWLCGDRCIHRREFCDQTGSCHSNFPIPCGDGQRCFRRQVRFRDLNLLGVIHKLP